jgi:uncharacterized protein YodC (DUF2158 family)
MSSYNCGDLVELKSGNVPMTVHSQEGNTVLCVWIFEGTVQQYQFESQMLVACDPSRGEVVFG